MPDSLSFYITEYFNFQHGPPTNYLSQDSSNLMIFLVRYIAHSMSNFAQLKFATIATMLVAQAFNG